MRTLSTAICTLEPQRQAHAAEMFVVLCDPAIYEFERGPPPSVERVAAGYQRLESRLSPDGAEHWLNWVVRLPGGELTGYVQATVIAGRQACIGYEFASRYWRRGIATAALTAMFQELAHAHDVPLLVAVLKAANYRSLGLLHKLGFTQASAETSASHAPEADEIVLLRPLQRSVGG